MGDWQMDKIVTRNGAKEESRSTGMKSFQTKNNIAKALEYWKGKSSLYRELPREIKIKK